MENSNKIKKIPFIIKEKEREREKKKRLILSKSFKEFFFKIMLNKNM